MALKYQGHVFDVMPACTCCVVGDAPQAVMVDPTGTGPIRTRFRTTTRIKWQQLRSLIREMIVTSDLLQLKAGGLLALTNPAIVGGAGKVQGFQNWIDLALEKVVLETTGGYMKPFINQAYEAGQAFASSVVGAGHASVDAVSREDLIHALAVVEMQGIIEAVSQQAVRAVANGLLNNKRPLAIVRDIWGIIERIGQTRTKTMIELIVVKAFGDATLDVYASVGITEVGLIPEGQLPIATTDARKKRASNIGRRAKAKLEREAAKAAAEAAREAAKRLKEARRAAGAKSAAKARAKRGGPGSRSRFSTPGGSTIARIESAEAKVARLGSVYVRTAGDDDVCPVCERIERGGPYKIDTARQLIPAHPHCRCVFIPANDKRFKRRLKSDTRDLEDGVPASLRTALTDMWLDGLPAMVAQLLRDAGGGNPNHDPEDGRFTSGSGAHFSQAGFAGSHADLKKQERDFYGDNTFTDAELKALKGYGGDRFITINGSLRRGDALTDQMRNMDSAISKSHFPKDAVVYRGVGRTLSEKIERAHAEGRDITFHDKAYVSTSANKGRASKFSKHMMEIHVPKGTSGLPLTGGSEAEILLARNVKMRVKGFRKTASGYRRIVVEVVPNFTKDSVMIEDLMGDGKDKADRFTWQDGDVVVNLGPQMKIVDSMGMSTFGTPGTSYAEATTQPNPVAPLNSRMPGGGASPKRAKKTPKGKHKKRGRHK